MPARCVTVSVNRGPPWTLRFHARSTFAVALAVNRWPLLRAGLDEVAGYDVGGPDVLARKIAIFEFLDRRNGFDVRTPRIPGLPYEAIARELVDDSSAYPTA